MVYVCKAVEASNGSDELASQSRSAEVREAEQDTADWGPPITVNRSMVHWIGKHWREGENADKHWKADVRKRAVDMNEREPREKRHQRRGDDRNLWTWAKTQREHNTRMTTPLLTYGSYYTQGQRVTYVLCGCTLRVITSLRLPPNINQKPIFNRSLSRTMH